MNINLRKKIKPDKKRCRICKLDLDENTDICVHCSRKLHVDPSKYVCHICGYRIDNNLFRTKRASYHRRCYDIEYNTIRHGETGL